MTDLEKLADDAIKLIDSMTKEELREVFLKYDYDPEEDEGYVSPNIGVFKSDEPLFITECT